MKNLITLSLIAVSFIMMITGCYTEQKASRQVYKAHRKHQVVTAQFCGSVYPPVSSISDSFIYKPGETLVLSDTVNRYDTVVRVLNRYIIKTQKRTDTLYIAKNAQLVNRAGETLLQQENRAISDKLAALSSRNKILLWVAIVLGGYTLLRWVLMYWRVRLP